VSGWLANPTTDLAALSFLPDVSQSDHRTSCVVRKRVRPAKSRSIASGQQAK
jgi:hypothetical protein